MTEIPEVVLSYGKISFWYNEMKVAEKLGDIKAFGLACKQWQAAQDAHIKICKKYQYKMYYDVKKP